MLAASLNAPRASTHTLVVLGLNQMTGFFSCLPFLGFPSLLNGENVTKVRDHYLSLVL